MGGMKKKGPARRGPKKSRAAHSGIRPERRAPARKTRDALPCEEDYSFGSEW